MFTLLADTLVVRERFAGPPAAWSFGEILIALVILGGALGIALIALRQFGLQIPQWVLQMLMIVAVVLVSVVLIRFVLGL